MFLLALAARRSSTAVAWPLAEAYMSAVHERGGTKRGDQPTRTHTHDEGERGEGKRDSGTMEVHGGVKVYMWVPNVQMRKT